MILQRGFASVIRSTTRLSQLHFQQPVCQSSFIASYQKVYDGLLSSECLPSEIVFGCFDFVHNYSGMPWWSAIICGTIFLRSVVNTPLYIKSLNNKHKQQIIFSSVDYEITKKLTEQGKHLNDFDEKTKKETWSQIKKVINERYRHYNVDPFAHHVLRLSFQFMFWTITSSTLRNMTGFTGPLGIRSEPCIGLDTEGTAWFMNLLIPDSYFVLPIITFTFQLINIVIVQSQISKPSFFDKMVQCGGLIFISCLLFCGTLCPAILPLFWSVSAGHQLATYLFFMSKKNQKLFNVVTLPGASARPYSDLGRLFVRRYFKK